MKEKRIYLRIYDGIQFDTAIYYANEMFKSLEGKDGIVKWKGGLCADLSTTESGNKTIRVWREK